MTAVLAGTPFDRRRSTCFVLEGVVHYLTATAVNQVLKCITELAGPARLILSFIDKQMRAKADFTMVSLFRAMKEPAHWFQTPEELVTLLRGHGFSRVDAWSFQEQVDRFVPPAVRDTRLFDTRWWQFVGRADRL